MKARIISSQPETALLYHVDESTQEGPEIREVLSQYCIAIREIPDSALGQTISAFLEKETFAPGREEPHTGAVILFSSVEARKRQEVLRTLRDRGAGRGAIKAVVTPTNRSWTFEKLFTELNAEHAFMTAQRAPEGEKGNGADE